MRKSLEEVAIYKTEIVRELFQIYNTIESGAQTYFIHRISHIYCTYSISAVQYGAPVGFFRG